MRLLLAQNMFYLPSHGGANRSDRLMLEQLAARGHECHAVVPLTGRLSHLAPGALVERVLAEGGSILEQCEGRLVYHLDGVTVHAAPSTQDLARMVTATVSELEPDWCLVPSDDPASMVLSAAFRATGKVVYIVHTIQQLPFGPRSFYPSSTGTAKVARTAGRISVSQAAQRYLLEWAGLTSDLYYPDVYSSRPARVAPFEDRRFVTLVNPCSYKGLPIFLQMADALPDVDFLAVKSWGTTAEDESELERRPNITVIPSTDQLDEIFGRTLVLVMPSLWDETFGYSCVEGLLRGVPVLSSGAGGLTEAGLGVARLLPVSPILEYGRVPGAAMPVPVVPPQDARPWVRAVTDLIASPAAYQDLARFSLEAAKRFVASTGPEALEKYLADL